MKIQLTEQSCILKEIGMSEIAQEVAILKKHFEPITLECAKSTLNKLSVKFSNFRFSNFRFSYVLQL